MPDRFRLYFGSTSWVATLVTVNYTMCDFKRGGATKRKNRLDLYQVQKRSNLIMLIVLLQTPY